VAVLTRLAGEEPLEVTISGRLAGDDGNLLWHIVFSFA
jgi:hypothetical protein